MANGDLLGTAVPRVCDAEGYVVILRWMRVAVVAVVGIWIGNTKFVYE